MNCEQNLTDKTWQYMIVSSDVQKKIFLPVILSIAMCKYKFSFLNQINRLQDKLYLKGKIYLQIWIYL